MQGIFMENDVTTIVDGKVKKNDFIALQAFEQVGKDFSAQGAIIGFPLKEFFIKNISLPSIEKKQLSNTIRLQKDFHLPYETSNAYVGHQFSLNQNELRLLIVSALKKDIQKPKAVFPAPIALYSLAMSEEMLEPGIKSILIFINGNEVNTLTVDGEEIVFMRSFPKDDRFLSDLKISAQSVYLQSERSLVEIDRVILFDDSEAFIEEIKSVFPADIRVVRVARLLSGAVNREDASKMIIPAGLALSERYLKKLKGWNVYQKETSYEKLVLKSLAIGIPLLLLFLPAFFYLDNLSNKKKLIEIKEEIDTIRPAYSKVMDLEGEVTAMEEFLASSGQDMASPEAWFKTIESISNSRPYELWFTNISGKTYGTLLLSGKAQSYDLITEYMKNLESKPFVDDVNLLFSQESREKGVVFQISLTMKTEE